MFAGWMIEASGLFRALLQDENVHGRHFEYINNVIR